jgi:type II secretory pathway pseudopilin PulG
MSGVDTREQLLMAVNMKNGDPDHRGKSYPGRWERGYSLLIAIIAVHLVAILLLMGRSMWETTIQRDLEEELIFRGRQYVTAIDLYRKKNNNLYPTNLEILFEKKFIRKLFKDPMSESGKWNLVLQPGTAGRRTLLIVPEELAAAYFSPTRKVGRQPARLIGVSSSSCEEGFRVYRNKKKYCEWAFYIGEKPDKEMPPLKFISQ